MLILALPRPPARAPSPFNRPIHLSCVEAEAEAEAEARERKEAGKENVK